MKMKQITAPTMKQAMTIAMQELGEDVVLIDNKKAPGGGVIVTFAVDQEDEVLFDEPFGLDGAVHDFAPEIPKPATTKVELNHPALDIIREALAYHGLPESLASRLMQHAATQRMRPDHVVTVAEDVLAAALTVHVRMAPLDVRGNIPERSVMLVGQHGAGKTSTISKLATELALHRQKVLLVSTDMERLGGADSLQLLADMLGCKCVVSETRMQLKTVLAAAKGKAWALIDSAGANIYEFSQLKALGELAGLNAVEPILVCPAGMDIDEAQELAGVFQFLPIERMIMTRLDAVRRLGSVFATLTSGGYALAGYTHSALPTDALEPMTAPALAKLMLRHVRERMTH